MGADGGVCWVELRDGKSIGDFADLFEPWVDSLLSINGGSDWGDKSRRDFVNDDPTVLRNPHGSFGTDVTDRPNLRDLDGLCEFLGECKDEGCLTWRDILLDIQTRPDWWCPIAGQDLFLDWMLWLYLFPVTPQMVRGHKGRTRRESYEDAFLRTLRETDIDSLGLNDFWDQSLEEWMQRLSITVKGSWADNIFYVHVDYEETWT